MKHLPATSLGSKTLSSANMSIVINLDKGCEIVAITHKQSQTQILFHSPWGYHPTSLMPSFGDSNLDWIYRYGGGWQVLLPHLSGNKSKDNQVQLFAESAMLPWQLQESSEFELTATINLISSPLTILRTIRIDGNSLLIDETITNTSSISQNIRWLHHPAFGEPFIEPGVRIISDARKLILEADREPYSSSSEIKDLLAMTSKEVSLDLSIIPASPRDIFATLADFVRGYVAIMNDRLDLGLVLEWDKQVFPYAWFWQDLRMNKNFPWFGRAYVTAIEPSSTIPGVGEVGEYARNTPTVVGGNCSISTELSLTLFQSVKDPHSLENALDISKFIHMKDKSRGKNE